MLRALPFALALACLAGCNRKEPEPDARPSPLVAKAPERSQPQDTSFRFPAAERIVAIGDVHGDVAATRAALRLAGALGDDDGWAGGKLVVVQTGDQLDRGDDEPEILDLFERLAREAKDAGGALHVLNGNHEVMNVQGDFRYVTEDGFRDYGTTPTSGEHAAHVNELPPKQRGRAAAFLPGKPVAQRLARRNVAVQVGDSVFVHGGLLEQHVQYGLGRMNREVQNWMKDPNRREPPRIATDENGPLWLRIYSDGTPTSEACGELSRALDRLSAKRLVVGHTVQKQGINSACQGRVFRIDVGLARPYGGVSSVLEIKGEQTRVLRGAP